MKPSLDCDEGSSHSQGPEEAEQLLVREGRDLGRGGPIRRLHVTTVGFIDMGADGQTHRQQHSSN